MPRPALPPITADDFPTPALILRTNDPTAQRSVRAFAHAQAEAARALHRTLTDGLRAARDITTRAEVFTRAFEAAEDWRYRIAAADPHPTGRYGAGHVERFRTPITDDNPNLIRIGEHERLRDGTVWDPTARTYLGGAETPASRTMRRIGALAAARFAAQPGTDTVCNRVTLPNGRTAHGMWLLRGRAAHHAAAEMVTRIATRGGDTSRIVTDGHLIYGASASESDRTAIFHNAIAQLAREHATSNVASAAWLEAAYLLYQAPRRKRGSDATTRVFLVAAGVCLLNRTPVLLDDVDLRAYVQPQHRFTTELQTAQSEPVLDARP